MRYHNEGLQLKKKKTCSSNASGIISEKYFWNKTLQSSDENIGMKRESPKDENFRS